MEMEADRTIDFVIEQGIRFSMQQVISYKILHWCSSLVNRFISQKQVIAPKELNFIIIPGSKGDGLYFETAERHFWYFRKKCADSQFLFFVDSTRRESEKIPKCRAKPEEHHNHEVLSQEMLELAAIRWQCLLRIISQPQETNFQFSSFSLRHTIQGLCRNDGQLLVVRKHHSAAGHDWNCLPRKHPTNEVLRVGSFLFWEGY